jgi:acyl-CoA synthetase (AMP-forming)/AMP-acid ligase II
MVRPGLPLIAAVFGLFALGAVPVIIDPGMGLKSFLACVARSRPARSSASRSRNSSAAWRAVPSAAWTCG